MRLLVLVILLSAACLAQPSDYIARYVGSSLGSNGAAITTWADTSANAFDLTNSSGSNRPTVNTATLSGAKGATFPNLNTGTNTLGVLTIPIGMCENLNSASIVVISESWRVSNNRMAVVNLGSATNNGLYVDHYGSLINSLDANTATEYAATGMGHDSLNAVVWSSGASAVNVYREYGSATGAALSATNLCGGTVGLDPALTTNRRYSGTILEIRVYNRAVTPTEAAQLIAYAASTYGVVAGQKVVNLVAVGDSITGGFGETAQGNYENLLSGYGSGTALGTRATIRNAGNIGITAATLLSNHAAIDAAYDGTYAKNLVFFWAGTNDLAGCANTSACNAAEATLETTYQSYCTAMHTVGYKFYAVTMLARTAQVAAFDVARLTFNAAIRTAGCFDGVIDPGGDPDMGVLPQTAGYFSDGTHPLRAGYQALVDRYFGPALSGLMPSTAASAFSGKTAINGKVVSK